MQPVSIGRRSQFGVRHRSEPLWCSIGLRDAGKSLSYRAEKFRWSLYPSGERIVPTRPGIGGIPTTVVAATRSAPGITVKLVARLSSVPPA